MTVKRRVRLNSDEDGAELIEQLRDVNSSQSELRLRVTVDVSVRQGDWGRVLEVLTGVDSMEPEAQVRVIVQLAQMMATELVTAAAHDWNLQEEAIERLELLTLGPDDESEDES